MIYILQSIFESIPILSTVKMQNSHQRRRENIWNRRIPFSDSINFDGVRSTSQYNKKAIAGINAVKSSPNDVRNLKPPEHKRVRRRSNYAFCMAPHTLNKPVQMCLWIVGNIWTCTVEPVNELSDRWSLKIDVSEETKSVLGAVLEKGPWGKDLVGSQDPYCVKTNGNLKHKHYDLESCLADDVFWSGIDPFPFTYGGWQRICRCQSEATPRFRKGYSVALEAPSLSYNMGYAFRLRGIFFLGKRYGAASSNP